MRRFSKIFLSVLFLLIVGSFFAVPKAEAAIAFRAASEAVGTFTGVEPTGAASGDVLLALVHTQGPGTHSGPAGWTQIGTQPANNGASETATVWWIVRGGSAPSYVWAGGGTTAQYIDVGAWSGCSGTPIDVSGQSADGGTSSPSVTTNVANAKLVALYAESNYAATVPSGMTRRDTGDKSSIFAELALGAAGATGAKAWGGTGGFPIAAWSVAFAPLPPPPSLLPPKPPFTVVMRHLVEM